MHEVGIDDLSIAVPSLYLPIEELAKNRDIDPDKLKYGLGLYKMALCDIDEDVITLGARAVIDLIVRHGLKPEEIGRIYVGTESSVDGSKPIATYIMGIVAQYYKSQGIDPTALMHCDAIDMTFACIGAFDAMHNSLLWLQSEAADGQVAIVVATDNALYDLASSGEYTQGAGAIATLLTRNPSILSVDLNIGVGTLDEHDFFKPLRLSYQEDVPNADQLIATHSETPVFDGPYSNLTYAKRINEAWAHFQSKHTGAKLDHFAKYAFHLPYAFHGRRILPDLYFSEMKKQGTFEAYLKEHGIERPSPESSDYKVEQRVFNKALTKTSFFKQLIANKVQPAERLSGEIGNVYTASVFLALMGSLYYNNDDLHPKMELLIIAYGSGSKSKIAKTILKENWKSRVAMWDIDKQLNDRTAISFETYLDIRRHKKNQPIVSNKSIAQYASGAQPTNKYARFYQIEDLS